MQCEQRGEARRKARGANRDDATQRMLVEIIAVALSVRPDRIASAARGTARTAFARQLAIYLACTRLGFSFTEAGRLFRRDRTTAAHACRRVEESRDDAAIDALIECLERRIAARGSADGEVKS